MQFYRYGSFCLCQAGGRLPQGAVPCSGHFAPLVFLVRRDPAYSRGMYPIHSYAELTEPETCGLLQVQPVRRPDVLDSWLQVYGACVLNTAFARCFEVLDAWYHARRTRLRVNLVGLGDVGATVLTGLKLLGREIAELGIYDANPALVERYCLEMNQVLPELDNAPLCAVRAREKRELFDCDVFLFTASRQVPPVGREQGDVRLAQYEKNRQMLREYAALARQAGFCGLFCQISDPVDLLSRAVFLDTNRGPDGAPDWAGLLPEQVQGYGLGVMRARAADLAGRAGTDFSHGAVFGPHGAGLVVANATDRRYDDAVSRALTEQVVTANFAVRALGFKPYLAPGLSSGCISVLRTLRAQVHDGAVPLGGTYFGCSSRLTHFGVQIRRQALHPALAARIAQSWMQLREFSYDG